MVIHIYLMLTRVLGRHRVRWNIQRVAALNYSKIFPQPIGGSGTQARRFSPDLAKQRINDRNSILLFEAAARPERKPHFL